MNEETEELDDSLVNIKGDVYELTGGKVSIMEDANTYKSTYQVLKEISQVWDDLSDKNQAQLLDKLFGKTRAQIGASIISNFSQAEKAIQTMADSAGVADRELDIIKNSLEYKINALRETAKGIWQNLFKREDVGSLVDFGTSVLGVFDKITEKLGLFKTAIAGGAIFAGIRSLVSAARDLGGISSLSDFFESIPIAFPNMANLVTSVGNLFTAFKNGQGIISGLQGVFSGLWGVIAAHPFVALAAGIAAAYLAFKHFNEAGAKAEENMNTAFDSFEESKTKVEEIKTELESIQGKMDEIKLKGSLSFVDATELSNLEKANELLQTQYDLARKDEAKKAKEAISSAEDAFNKNYGDINSFLMTGGKLSRKSIYDAAVENQFLTEYDEHNKENLVNAVAAYMAAQENGNQEAMDSISEMAFSQLLNLNEYRNKLNSIDDSLLKPEVKQQKDALLNTIDGLSDLVYEVMDPEAFQVQQFGKLFNDPKYAPTIEGLKTLAKNAKGIGITADQIKQIAPVLSQAFEDGGFAVQDIADAVNSEVGIFNSQEAANQAIRNYYKNKRANQDVTYDAEEGVQQALEQLEEIDEEVEEAAGDEPIEVEKDVDVDINVNGDEDAPESFGEFFRGLTEEAQKTVLSMQADGFDFSAIDSSQWTSEVRSYMQSTSDASDSTVNLAGDLSDLQYAFGDAGAGLTSAVSNYKTQMNTLATAREKFKKGELTTEDMLDLQGEFYELNNFDMSNLGDGIQKQMETITGSFATTSDSYKDFKKEISNDESLKKALNAFNTGDQLRKALAGGLGEEKEGQANALLKAAQEYGLVQKDSTDSVNDFTNALYSETKAVKKATGIIGKFDDAIELVGGETTDAGRALIKMRDNLIGLYDITGDSATAYDHLKTQLSAFSDYQTTANNALKSSRSATGLTTDEVEKLTAAYRNVKGFNPAKLFEQTANGIHLNQQEFKRLNEEVKKNTLTDMYTDLLAKQSQLDALRASGGDTSALEADIQNAQLLIAQYEGLTSAYNAWITAKSNGNERDSYESLGKSAYDDMKKIMDAGWKGDESLNSYLDLMLSASQRTNDVYADFAKLDQKIEGTSHSLMDYWQYDGDGSLVVDGLANFLKDVNSVMGDEYVSMGEDGMFGIDFTGEKLQEVADRFGMSTELLELFGRAMIDAGMNVDFTDQKLVDTSNTLKELQDQGVISPEIDTSGISSVNETVEEAHATLDSLTAEKKRLELEADVNTDAIDALDVAIEAESSKVITMEIEAQLAGGATIEEMIGWTDEEIMANLHVDSSQVDEARAKLEELGGETETTTITVQLEESQFDALTETEKTVTINYEGEPPELESPVPVEIEYSGDQPEVTSPVNVEINYTGEPPKLDSQSVSLKYNKGSSGLKNSETVNVNYSGTPPKVDSPQTVDIEYNAGDQPEVESPKVVEIEYHSNGDEKTFEDQNPVVNYTVNSPDAPEYPDQNPAVNYGINAPSAPVYPNQYPTISYRLSAPAAPSYPNMSRTITYTIRTVGSAPSGTKHADGTMTSLTRAHASGTAYNVANYKNAYADGKIALDSDEIALVNELGTESIIRDGKWMLLPQGMHQEYLKKGDIVLSAKQTQALINTGAALGHGRAYAFGTLSNAYYTGSGTIGRPNQTSTTGGGGGTSTGGSGTGGGGGGSSTGGGGGGNTTQQTTPAADTSTEQPEEPEWFDWIELKLDRIERKVEKLKKQSEDTFRSWTNRAKSLKDQISATTEELNTQQQAYNRYMQQANSVGLSDDLKKAVQEGRIDINQYDENTQKLIEDYQKWYEKALDCSDAIDDLNLSLKDLYKQQFDNIVKKWENALQNLQHATERTEALISRRNDYASDYVESIQGRTASRRNIQSYNELISSKKLERIDKGRELRELQATLNAGLKKGTIEKDSEEYYELLKEIQNVENDIDKIDSDLISYSNSISAEYVNLFNNFAQDFENKLSLAQHLQNEYQNYLELAEAKGYATSAVYYNKLKTLEQKKIQENASMARILQKNLNSAVASGEIKVGSQAWYDMTQRINEANEAVQEGEIAVANYNKQIREISWERFDYLIDKMDNLTSETNFLIDLFDNSKLVNDNGSFTKEGQSVLALHGVNLDVYMEEAAKYGNQIKNLNKQIAKDPGNQELINRRDELLKKQQESITAAEKEKKAIKDLVADGIKKELSAMKDLISEYKDAIDSQKDLYEYQKKLKDKTSEINKIQKQLSAYSNDTSEETRAKIQKLQVDLEEKQEELRETEYEHMISETKKMLDDFYQEYEETLNARLDDIDQLIKEVVESTNSNKTTISKTIRETASDVGYTMSTEMSKIFDPKNKLDIINGGIKTHATAVSGALTTLVTSVNKIWEIADAQAKKDAQTSATNQSNTNQATQQAQQQSQGQGTKPTARAATTTKKTTTTKKATTTKKTTTTKKATTTKKHSASASGGGSSSTPTLTDEIKKHVAAAIWSGRYGWEVDPVRAQRLSEVFGANNGIQAIVSMGYNYSAGYSPEGYSYLEMRKKFKGYASGIKRIKSSELAWTNENADKLGGETILRSSDHAVLTHLGANDRIYNAMASSRLWDAANNPAHYIAQNAPQLLAQGSANGGVAIDNVNFDNITFELPNVKNYEELVIQMQNDNKFEKLIQSMTLGRINGKPSGNKYKYNFGN